MCLPPISVWTETLSCSFQSAPHPCPSVPAESTCSHHSRVNLAFVGSVSPSSHPFKHTHTPDLCQHWHIIAPPRMLPSSQWQKKTPLSPIYPLHTSTTPNCTEDILISRPLWKRSSGRHWWESSLWNVICYILLITLLWNCFSDFIKVMSFSFNITFFFFYKCFKVDKSWDIYTICWI